jgi:transposase
LIRSIPGIGKLNALLLLTEIGDINRFGTFYRLCAYIGLIPNTHSSGENERVNNITYRGHPKLREALIESSWCAIRKDPALTMAFSEYSKRMKKNKAIMLQLP